MDKPRYILGISESHTASAALLKDGEIIACASEERFTGNKLQSGIPEKAVQFCLDFAKISFQDISQVAVADLETPFIYQFNKDSNPYQPSWLTKFFLDLEEKLEKKIPASRTFLYDLYKNYRQIGSSTRQRSRLKLLQQIIPLEDSKFIFLKHHLCHAAGALFASPYTDESTHDLTVGASSLDQTSSGVGKPSTLQSGFYRDKKVLVFTSDGVGDFESATIYKFSDGKIKQLVSIDSQQSLGFFYQHITQYLGMRPVEDEYKVMGLAPYGQNYLRAYNTLAPFFKLNRRANKWSIPISEIHLYRKLPELLGLHRFDQIAAACQKILEEIIVGWVENAVRRFKVSTIVCGGGVFANIKLNQKVASIKAVSRAFFMPSAGDESNAIGAAYYCYFQTTQKSPQPLKNLYLGPEFSGKEILRSLKGLNKKYLIKKPQDLNKTIAWLLANNQVVARFTGRMEFGARALGNRSILSNPANKDLVEFINFAIKNRDFWMPFAPTILDNRVKDYLIKHSAYSPFMNVGFDTTALGQNHLKAAIHPYDKTARPQILVRGDNPGYYDLIKEFEKLTGIGALLNSSFNLHREPLVCTPQDALRVFDLSGLKYLILEDILITKK